MERLCRGNEGEILNVDIAEVSYVNVTEGLGRDDYTQIDDIGTKVGGRNICTRRNNT